MSSSCCIFNDSSSSKSSNELIIDRLFPNEIIDDNLIWNIKNKYYEADVQLIFHHDNLILKENEDIQAILIYLDSESSKWNSASLIKSLEEKEVQLLVIESRSCMGKELVEWIDSGTTSWELIDLSEDLDNEDEGGGIFAKDGFERIVEALQTTPWSNSRPPRPSTPSPPPLTPKKTSTSTPPSSPAISLSGASAAASAAVTAASASSKSAKSSENVEDFETLFSQFAKLKNTSESITDPGDRKKYAEQVVMSFWNAMGGDPEEIQGLSDDSDLAEDQNI